MSALDDVLSAVAAAMHESAWRWYLFGAFGAQAATLWGPPRERAESLDIGRIRGTLHLLKEALAQSDLLVVFETEIEKLR